MEKKGKREESKNNDIDIDEESTIENVFVNILKLQNLENRLIKYELEF